MGLINLPEGRGQANLAKDVAHLGQGTTGEVAIQTVSVPQSAQVPPLHQREGFATRQILLVAPAVQMHFRPEEEDGRSGEDKVVIPALEGEGEVD